MVSALPPQASGESPSDNSSDVRRTPACVESGVLDRWLRGMGPLSKRRAAHLAVSIGDWPGLVRLPGTVRHAVWHASRGQASLERAVACRDSDDYDFRMREPVEIAVQTYIRAASEPDAALRAQLLEQCFAQEGRFVTRSRVLRGRAEVAAMLTRVHADPQLLRIRLLSVVDATGRIFRFRSLIENRDGTSQEFFDAGEIDADGKISLLLTFAGPLAKAEEPPSV